MIQNSLFLNACKGIKGGRPPVWFMRQAGRYLAEYRAVRANNSMLDVIRTPELAAEVTLQPIRRFGFDASIIFADILNPLIGMGLDLDFIEKTGPVISNPVRSRADIEKLSVPDAIENTGYTAEAIALVTKELNPLGVPLIGFAGAPFTLSAYAIEGGKIGALQRVKEFMFTEPESWRLLQNKFVALLVDYLVMQVEAGASAIQIFDSWLGQLSPQQYLVYVEPYLKEIFAGLRARTTVPLLFFSTGTAGLYSYFAKLDIDVLGVDWRIDLQTASKLIDNKLPLQGNLDPILLLRGGDALEREVSHILRQSDGLPAHIFNLGHGILPATPVEHVASVLAMIRGATS